MDTNNNNLPGAIDKIRELAQQASGAGEIRPVKVTDAFGGEIEIPVALLPAQGGAMQVTPLMGVVREGLELAERRRLSIAGGPDWRIGQSTHHTLQSLMEYVNRHKGDNTVIWADGESKDLLAVFDYHRKGGNPADAGWQRHRAFYNCTFSGAWRAWGGGSALQLGQEELSKLLDERDADLTGGDLRGGRAPDPSFMLSFLSKLESYSDAKVKAIRDPNTHQRKLAYSKESGFVGDITPPKAFLINIPVFEGQQPDQLEVRLRAEVSANGEATFQVQIHDADTVMREAFDDLCAALVAATSLPLFVGRPEASTNDEE